jgi:hypothetical protein
MQGRVALPGACPHIASDWRGRAPLSWPPGPGHPCCQYRFRRPGT